VAGGLAARFLFTMLGPVADTLLVYLAASLTRPIQPVLDTFAARTGIVVQRESGASLEHVRKITELHRVPDLLLLADVEVFPQLLVPQYATWYAEFARNRMVVAYTKRSKHAGEITRDNWMDILRRGDVEVGRTDPDLAPVGYRTLIMLDLAERFYRKPGLAKSLLAAASERNIRPNAAELAALLAAGELDYIYDYQSVAESSGHISSKTVVGDDRPCSTNAPTPRTRWRVAHFATASDTRTCVASRLLSDSMRCAVFTMSPIAVYS
jgi:molybdate/tungstate transport system substrate-binding protein